GTVDDWSLQLSDETVTYAPADPVPAGGFVNKPVQPGEAPKPIGDPGTPHEIVTSTLTVSGLNPLPSDLRVHLNLSHSSTEQLIITLTSPQNTTIHLFNGPLGLTQFDYFNLVPDDNFVNTTFDDSAFGLIGPPAPGSADGSGGISLGLGQE